jgi:uncharacterized protein (TIGR02246 family)
VLAGCGQDVGTQRDPLSDRGAIEASLRQWPRDFNARNLDAACSLFADDLLLVYPGAPDRDRDAFCSHLREVFNAPAKTFSYDEPDIKEVLVDGDLATVRLFWTLTVKDASGTVLETVREDGVDVFRRQPDGSWKIHISHAFTK